MFNRPGKKLLTAAKIVFWLGAAASALYAAFVVLTGVMGVALLETGGVALPVPATATAAIVTAALTLLLGLFASWVASLVLSGFGRLIENSEAVAALARPQRSIEAPQLRQTGR